MRRFGVHTSIAGGLYLSLLRAHALGCTTMQIFTHSPRSWAAGPISKPEIDTFKGLRKDLGINPVYSHASYLINIASPDNTLRSKSVHLLREEIKRADLLGLDYVVLHTGTAHDPDGRHRASRSIREALSRKKHGAGLLIENTAGKRGDIASTMEEIGWLLKESGGLASGVCIDSCHAFAAGYDIRIKRGLDRLACEIEHYIGPGKVKLLHLNDSKGAVGSRTDRHEHLGRGMIGHSALKRFISCGTFVDIPIVLETPKKSERDDTGNLRVLRKML